MILHVDANSFYASCERLFRPDLYNKPIAVLSNNDGIVVAADSRCKALGVKRGNPFFKIRSLCREQGIIVFSSNYTLYADISSRINAIYNEEAWENEVYSIDESFLHYPNWQNVDYTDLAHKIRERVLTEIGIPISVGIAQTKTLAKLCNRLAKKHNGIFTWQHSDAKEVLQSFPVSQVWGIGKNKADLLSRHGIHSAYDLTQMPLNTVKELLTITGVRTVEELRGKQVIQERESIIRKGVSCSRSFHADVHTLSELKKALSHYIHHAVHILRSESLSCRIVQVSLMTARPYNTPPNPRIHYFAGESQVLPDSSSAMHVIQHAAFNALEHLYRSGFAYRKVSVSLLSLEKSSNDQGELFMDDRMYQKEKDENLMRAAEYINDRYGKMSMVLASTLLSKQETRSQQPPRWYMKRDMLSPCYTTRLCDVPVVF